MAFFNDISLGHYYPIDSLVHRLDPRTKLISVMLLMISLLFSLNVAVLIFYFVISFFIILLSRIPLKLVLGNLKPFVLLFIITLFIHLFWTSGKELFLIPGTNISITQEGLELGIVYALRLGLLIVLAALLSLSTSPIEITDALEKMLNPLKKFKLPTHEIVMMLSLSLRFIPTLMEEAERIKNAQISRGSTFEGNLLKRFKSIIPLVMPLFVSAFRRADELAYAMDSRCYIGGDGRTSYKKLNFQKADLVVFILIAAVSLASFIIVNLNA
jgi:energy-coupling factor transport system permease protein